MPEKKPRQCATCGAAISRRAHYCRECFLRRRRPIEERFWAKVVKGPGCWGWTGNTTGGYGLLGRGGVGEGNIRAPRLSYELHYGPIPSGLFVLHRCDNPPCVRPDHLFLGTQADNMADAARKGRAGRRSPIRGEDNPNVKLSTTQVAEIRKLYAAGGVTQMALASEYGITQTQVSRVVRGESW